MKDITSPNFSLELHHHELLQWVTNYLNKFKTKAHQNKIKNNSKHSLELEKLAIERNFKNYADLSGFISEVQQNIKESRTGLEYQTCLNRDYDLTKDIYYIFSAYATIDYEFWLEDWGPPVRTSTIEKYTIWVNFDEVSGKEIRSIRPVNYEYINAIKTVYEDKERIIVLNTIDEVFQWMWKWRGYAIIEKSFHQELIKKFPSLKKHLM
ncbi:hypothetical protein PGH07_03350 [Sulfurovum sp. zt1-1]|uniref:Uncharacterized protein n=1 Tax=Sulfurovum zhangzhouensis TaxID=3019067 RepID=A0ABT7QWJ0_9BACT|nr:hypothetical protein [Sulfurovum zhangzhouensis]MDM5271203.1 hypothetical protein [Sulfurovum zhangzhouensis]